MKNSMRLLGIFYAVLLAIALSGCASAVDDPARLPAEEAALSSTEALNSADATNAEATDPKASDCASATDEVSDDKAYAEFYSVLEKASVSKDSPELAGGSCSAACRCCKWGNRFCCSHCRFCSGPIGATGGVFAP